MLEVGNLHAWYGDAHTLYGVDLVVPTSGAVALIGRNGAGKSTLLKSILGAGPRTEGRLMFRGKSLAGLPAFRRARMGLGLVPEDRRVFPQLSVRQNLEMAAYAAGDRAPRPWREVMSLFPMLEGLEGRLGFELSGGQQQMLAIARTALARPKLLLLDEPTEGLAPSIVEALAGQINQICEGDGTGLLLAEQNLSFARQCTTHVNLIDSGRIVFSGNWNQFDQNGNLLERHLAV